MSIYEGAGFLDSFFVPEGLEGREGQGVSGILVEGERNKEA